MDDANHQLLTLSLTQVARVDSDIVRMLKERICRHKAELRTFEP